MVKAASALCADGSMSATTLSRGPSLCSSRKEWFHGPSSEPKLILPAPTMTTLKSEPGAGGVCLSIAVTAFGSNSGPPMGALGVVTE